jgi:hypothetical protein
MRASNPPEDTVHGSCLCGGIAFHAALPEEGANHCYCTMCQKFHGAAAGSYLSVYTKGFVVERGAELIVDYASSEFARRGFCKTCGSALYWRSTKEPDVIDLSLGTLQPPWTGTIEREVYLDTRPSWLPHR